MSQHLARPITRIAACMSPTQSPPQCETPPPWHRRNPSHRALLLALAMIGLCVATGGYAAGTLVTWGDDQYGQVSGTPAGSNFVAASAGGYHSVALRSDGSLVSWGWDGLGQVSGTPTGNGFIAASAGFYHSVALRSDGSLVSWGYDLHGSVSGTPVGNDFIAVSAGYLCGTALRSDGSLVSWGENQNGQVSGTPAGNGFGAVSAGTTANVALRSDGSLVSWGGDFFGQISATPSGSNFIAASAGEQGTSVALRSDGSLISWGRDLEGEVSGTPAGNNFIAVSAGGLFSIAMRSDSTLVAWGYDFSGQVSGTPAGNGFTAFSAGSLHSVAIGTALTPEAQIAALSDAVQALVTSGALLPAQGNSLQTKLSAAKDLLTRGNTQGAISKLGDFVKQVTSLIKTGKLTSAQGQPLIDAAQALMAELQGSTALSATSSGATGRIASTSPAALALPESFRLYPATVEADRGTMMLRFDLPGHSDVSLEFYDITGRRVDEVRLGSMGPGQHQWSWAPLNQPSGLVFYRLRAGDLVVTGKAAFVR